MEFLLDQSFVDFDFLVMIVIVPQETDSDYPMEQGLIGEARVKRMDEFAVVQPTEAQIFGLMEG